MAGDIHVELLDIEHATIGRTRPESSGKCSFDRGQYYHQPEYTFACLQAFLGDKSIARQGQAGWGIRLIWLVGESKELIKSNIET